MLWLGWSLGWGQGSSPGPSEGLRAVLVLSCQGHTQPQHLQPFPFASGSCSGFGWQRCKGMLGILVSVTLRGSGWEGPLPLESSCSFLTR